MILKDKKISKVFLNKFYLTSFLLVLVCVLETYILITNAYKTKINSLALSTIPNQNLKIGQEKEIWANLIKNLGPEKAYQQFKLSYQKASPGKQHNGAHIFGQALYEIEKENGIYTCDSSFAFGCYHSFLGAAIQAKGLAVVPSLNQKCSRKLRSQALGCRHGLGHGILAYLGYNYNDLVKALDVCNKLPGNDTIGGCVGGIFMEYNFQTVLLNEGKTRELDPQKPFFPCDVLPKSFSPPCYYWQAQWWTHVLSGSYATKYQMIGKFCEKLQWIDKEQCFIGSGNTAGPFAEYDIRKTIKLCEAIGSQRGSLLCRIGAAGSFQAEPSTHKNAYLLCGGLSQTEQKECIVKSSL